jgi:hypothetical protein
MFTEVFVHVDVLRTINSQTRYNHRRSKALLVTSRTLALTASAASVALVRNDEGDCWRVRDRPAYGPELGLSIDPDDWR